MTSPRIGLLPLYLALYDEAMPDVRPGMERFYRRIADALASRGLAVETAPFCRLRDEVHQAVRSFENASVDAIVTIHLAYSPSLESAEVLARSPLPIIVLDTTPDVDFGPDQSPDAIMFNHGIHGVQDLCNLLIRHGKAFQIEAGHWQQSDVLDRVTGWAHAARMARAMRSARVGRLGDPFAGMGDFAVPEDILKATIGVTTLPSAPVTLRAYLPALDDPEVAEELAADRARFDTRRVSVDAHREAVRAGWALRRWISEERLTALSVNFLACNQASGLPTMPFLEIDKAMARGIGYAGEGDVLTAAFVGALLSCYPETTFTEMFCPDWAGNTIFLSHMGEVNSDLLVGTPSLIEKPFPWTDARDPVCPVGCMKAGPALLADLAPSGAEHYTLILSSGTMVDGGPTDQMSDTVHGWFRPSLPVHEFLASYSRYGGTHHCALVYGDVAQSLRGFGEMMGWGVVDIADEE